MRGTSVANILTKGKLNDGLRGSGGIAPVVLNLDIVYGARQQLHGQAVFIPLGK